MIIFISLSLNFHSNPFSLQVSLNSCVMYKMEQLMHALPKPSKCNFFKKKSCPLHSCYMLRREFFCHFSYFFRLWALCSININQVSQNHIEVISCLMYDTFICTYDRELLSNLPENNRQQLFTFCPGDIFGMLAYSEI